MILELDLGNSRIKWRLMLHDGSIADQGAAQDLAEFQGSLAPKSKLSHCRICSVRRGAVLNDLVLWLDESFGLTAQVAKVTARCGQVANQYQDPARLGVDRWLAMLAAYQRVQGPCIIIDGGTALTLDILDSEGLHQGGFILPGLSLMARSLEQNTAIKLSTRGQVPSIAPGHSTDQAVRNGILAAVIALIERLHREQSDLDSGGVRVVLTGGDAATISATLEHSVLHPGPVTGVGEPAEIVKDLVLDGLALACPIGSPWQ
jgi:type III pantothenate kinase